MRRELCNNTFRKFFINLLHNILLMLLFVALDVVHPLLPGSLWFPSKSRTKLENPSLTNTSQFVDCNLTSVVLQGKTRLPLQILTRASKNRMSGRIPSRWRWRPTTTVRTPPAQPRKIKSQQPKESDRQKNRNA